MTRKDFAIGVLSTTAVILLVGLLLINAGSRPVQAGTMTETIGDYTVTVGVGAQNDIELVYVLDATSQRVIAYAFNTARTSVEPIAGIDLKPVLQGAPAAGGRGRRP